MSNPPPSTPFVPPSITDWDLLFQPLFVELLTPPSSVDHPSPEVITPIAEVVAPEPDALTGSPSTKTVDQDAPSSSNSQTTPKTQSPVISNNVKEENHDLDVAHMNNDPFFGFEESQKTPNFLDDPLHESLHKDSTSQGSSSNIRQTHTPFESLGTPLVKKSNLDEDLQGKPVDATLYRDMIGSLMYLTSSRTDLTYAASYVPAYADTNHARCQDTRRNTSGSAQFIGDKLVSWSSKKQKCTAILSTKAE
nr:hypothetical protein [Tanacetum cinerariifolium]